MLPVMELSPANIRFMHARINDKFQNGNSVNETVEMIASGKWKVQCLPRIRVVKRDGCYYAFDNRRLYVYRVLHYRGFLKTIKVNLSSIRQFQPHKLSTKNNGKSVTVRRDVTLQHCEDENSWKTFTSDVENRRKILNNALAYLSIRDDSISDDDDPSSDDDDDDDVYFRITKPKQNSAIAGWRSSNSTTSCSTSLSSLYRPRVHQYTRTSLMANITSANSISHISSGSLYARSNIRPYSVSTSQTTSSSTSLYASSQQPKSSDGLRRSYLITSNRLERHGSILNPLDRSHSSNNGARQLFTQSRVSSYYGTSLSSYDEDQEKHGSVHSSYDLSHPTSNGTREFSTHPRVSSCLGTSLSNYGDGQEKYGSATVHSSYNRSQPNSNSAIQLSTQPRVSSCLGTSLSTHALPKYSHAHGIIQQQTHLNTGTLSAKSTIHTSTLLDFLTARYSEHPTLYCSNRSGEVKLDFITHRQPYSRETSSIIPQQINRLSDPSLITSTTSNKPTSPTSSKSSYTFDNTRSSFVPLSQTNTNSTSSRNINVTPIVPHKSTSKTTSTTSVKTSTQTPSNSAKDYSIIPSFSHSTSQTKTNSTFPIPYQRNFPLAEQNHPVSLTTTRVSVKTSTHALPESSHSNGFIHLQTPLMTGTVSAKPANCTDTLLEFLTPHYSKHPNLFCSNRSDEIKLNLISLRQPYSRET